MPWPHVRDKAFAKPQRGLQGSQSDVLPTFAPSHSGGKEMHTASRTAACAADAQPSVLLAAVKQRAGQRAPNLATRLARELARQLPAKLHFLSSFQIEHAKHGPRQRSKVVHSSLSTTFMESKSGARTTTTSS
jgi:hypothetical protein